MSLSILFPAFNEESSIGRAVDEALRCGDRLRSRGRIDELRIIVVDDGSTDATPEVLAALHRRFPERLTVVRHETNRGLGAAVRSALDAVTTDLAFYTDVDLPVDLIVVDRALDLADQEQADLVSAFRRSRRGEGPRRYAYSILYNGLIRLVLGVRVRDVNFAAKLIRMDALDGVELRSEGSFVDVELLARLQRRGCRIAQLPADYQPRSKGVSTLSSAPVIRTMLEELRQLRPSILAERPVANAAP